MRAWVREEFTGTGWRWYMVAAVPMATLIAAVLPPAFDPFAVAACIFPLFFFFIRRGRLASALWSLLLWLALHGALVALLIGWDRSAYQGAFVGPADFGWIADPAASLDSLTGVASKGAADFLFTLLLSALSGGALPLIAAVSAASDTGMAVGGLLATYDFSSGSVEAAFLSVRPWNLMAFVGAMMGSVGGARWFTLRLERRSANDISLIRYILAGFTLLFFSFYLQYYLGPVWEDSYRSALSLLTPA